MEDVHVDDEDATERDKFGEVGEFSERKDKNFNVEKDCIDRDAYGVHQVSFSVHRRALDVPFVNTF